MRRKQLIYSAAVAIFLLAVGIGAAVFYSPLFTHYIEGDAFCAAMEKETAKGLHFPECRYAPIRRVSVFTAQTESFEARNGVKAMKSLHAHGIMATIFIGLDRIRS